MNLQTGGGKNIRNFCGRPKWKPPNGAESNSGRTTEHADTNTITLTHNYSHLLARSELGGRVS